MQKLIIASLGILREKQTNNKQSWYLNETPPRTTLHYLPSYEETTSEWLNDSSESLLH